MVDRLIEWWERKFFRVAAYLGVAFLTFVSFLLITFPQHRVVEILSVQAEAALDHRYEVDVEGMSFWRLSGVRLEGVRLKERQVAAGSDAPMAMTVRVEEVAARFAPLASILNRGPTIRYQLDIGGGEIRGNYTHRGASGVLTSKFNGLDLRQSTLVSSLLGVPVLGSLDGDVELVFNLQRGTVVDGGIDLRGRNLTLLSTVLRMDSIPILTELDLPTTRFGNLVARITIEEGEQTSRMLIEEMRTSASPDIQMELWGHTDMVHGGGSRPDLSMRMQVGQEYITENNLGFLFNMREVRNGQRGEWYGFQIGGRSGNIQFQGSTTAALGPGGEEPAGDAAGSDDAASAREEDE